ncbi:hypothetical protein [Caldibacillus debilis]|uniref:Uncharacterized protein n=1 Tax=Caldibacillus debilis GB1 TaxID=1339248 RepID=A0A420VE49_9BACI|nr:hypothetical protein [Caldibacillus debilis]RKO61790.1 hypothetical protein Cdeb_01283 [Caldibacillus debilis GB1]
MKNILAKVKNSKGFVSLETIAIAVVVVVIACIVMFKFKGTVSNSSDTINQTISDNVNDINREGTYSN